MAVSPDAAGLIDEEQREPPRVHIPLVDLPIKATLQQAARDGQEDVVFQLINRLPKYHKTQVLDAKDSDGYTAMHYAAKFNRYKIMKLLISSGATADIKGSDDDLTPLHFAARYIPRIVDEAEEQHESVRGENATEVTIFSSSKKAVQFLIHNCHVDVNHKAQYGISPLHLACQRANYPAVKALLESQKIDLNIADDNQDTPLHEACLSGDQRIVELLLQKMKQEGVNLLLQNDEKQTPLHVACSEGHTEIVKLILQSGFQQRKDLVTVQDNEFSTPLHLACENGNEEIVRILLLNGADIHAAKDEEISPLHLAARHGFIKVATILLDSGLDIINILDAEQQTPLHYAAQFNQCEMITFLLKKGARIDPLDNDSYTPVLMSAAYGQTDAFSTLLEQGAPIDVVDKDGKSAVFLAAEHNHIPVLKILVSNQTGLKLCRTVDSSHNTPLHVAAAKGNIGAVKLLLVTKVKVDARNELNKTPMHLASQNGHVAVVRELIRNRPDTIADEDEDGNTPLHLACIYGHTSVAKTLIDSNADVEARNAILWTPMDCAAARGHQQLVELLINAEADVDPTDKSKITPLHLACREGHLRVVNVLLAHGADVTNIDQNGFNALDLAIENGHRDIAMVIIKSTHWAKALRNCTDAPWGGVTTPLRKLIRKMPEVAEEVFNQCTFTNATKDGQIRPDSKDYRVIFNYEFLEDFQDPRSKLARAFSRRHKVNGSPSEASSQDETESAAGKLERRSKAGDKKGRDVEAGKGETLGRGGTLGAYTHMHLAGSDKKGFMTDWGPVGFKKSRHPLSIMVESQRIDLLKHPLVTSLLNYKWRTYGRYFYFGNLLVYIIFLLFLTAFALTVTNPLEPICRSVFNDSCPASGQTATQGSGNGMLAPNVMCDCGIDPNRMRFIFVGAIIIVFFSLIRLTMEFLQFIQLRLRYLLSWVNWIECTLFACAIIFAWIFHTDCYCPFEWQWQIGAAAVFLGWINLIIFFRKLPLTGIFVVMFVDIFYTFLKMIVLSFLLVIAFSLAFYMAFFEPGEQFERSPFATPARAIVKTMTMTTGEFEFDGIFRQVPGGLGMNFPEIEFVPISFILWIIFLILMPILLMNLLVGLAVDDIKGIQEAAVLKRLALQVELALSAEELFPKRIRRWFIIGSQEIKPNRPLTVFEHFRYIIWGGQRHDSAENIDNALHPPLEPIEEVHLQMRSLLGDVDKMRQLLTELSERNQILEALTKEMAKKQGVSVETTSGGELSFL